MAKNQWRRPLDQWREALKKKKRRTDCCCTTAKALQENQQTVC